MRRHSGMNQKRKRNTSDQAMLNDSLVHHGANRPLPINRNVCGLVEFAFSHLLKPYVKHQCIKFGAKSVAASYVQEKSITAI